MFGVDDDFDDEPRDDVIGDQPEPDPVIAKIIKNGSKGVRVK